jgi:hypothetical protein
MISSHSEQNKYKIIQINSFIFARASYLFATENTLQALIYDKIFVEIPIKLDYSYPEKVPPPHNWIEYRRRSLYYLRSGNISWWVMLSAWGLSTSKLLLLAYFCISNYPPMLIPLIPLEYIPFNALCRGTMRKTNSKKNVSMPSA